MTTTAPKANPTTELERLRSRVRELEALQAERDRVEAESRASESGYRSLFEEAATSMWENDWSAVKAEIDALRASGVQDLGGYIRAHPELVQVLVGKIKVINFNKATVEIYRAPDRETLWRGMNEFLAGTYWDDFSCAVEALASGDSRHVIECRERTFDGNEIFVRIMRWIPEAHRDSWSRVIEIVEDITEHKRAQEAQRQALSHLGHAQKMAKLGHWEWRLDDGLIYPSHSMAAIFGMSRDELRITDERYLSFVHPMDRKQAARAFGPSDQVSEVYETEYRIIRPDGQERVLFEIGEPAFDASGKPIGMFGTVQDVTERKQTERELLSARRRAELANRTKSEFLANTSHELRSPLNVIIGFSELIILNLKAANTAPKHLEYVEDIRNAGRHLLELINDILDLSKIETGKLTLDESLVDLSAVIGACSGQFTEQAVAAGLQLEQRLDGTLPPVWADKTKIKQILLNLLSNAIKFTPRGGAISVNATIDRRQGVLISVSDTGIGIARDKIPVALERFGQVDGTLSRKFEGTGLGLPLTKALAELHGGDLQIESEMDRGTTVSVSLPLVRVRRVVA